MRALRGSLGVERQKSRVGVAIGARAGRVRPGGSLTRAVGHVLDGVGEFDQGKSLDRERNSDDNRSIHPIVTVTQTMSEQPTTDQGKRRAGRPRGEQPPMTTAERMRAMRDRARQAAIFETDWASASDTRLTEAAGHLMRAGRPALLARVAIEMMSRANARRLDVAGAVKLDWRVVDPSRSSEPSESVDQGEPIQGSEPVEAVESSASNPSKPMVSVTVTNSATVDQGELFALPSLVPDLAMSSSTASASNVEPVASKSSASKSRNDYPTEVKAKAILALRRGQSKGEVLALISRLMPNGRAPHGNYHKLVVKQWPNDPRVVEILAKLEAE